MTNRDVTPIVKGETRPWICRRQDPTCTRTNPCRADLGARNRRKGKKAQGNARKVLEKMTGTSAAPWAGKLANEESWDSLPVRVECKAGRGGGANTIWTHYLRCENQSLAAKAIGDTRPFIATYKPDETSEQLVVIRLSQLAQVVEELSK